MRSQAKLVKLLKSRALNERDVLREHKRIDDVLVERRKLYQQAVADKDAVKDRIDQLEFTKRSNALMRGDANTLVNLSIFISSLRKKLSQLECRILSRLEELKSAEVLLEFAQKEVLNARVERRQVETLISEYEQAQQTIDAALEEAMVDDMSVSRHRNR